MADKYDADKYSELERLARAATKAPWFFNPNAGDDGELYSVTHRNQRNPGLDVAFTHVAHDAKFIAAANPAVVLDLIAELRRLRAAVIAYRTEHDAYMKNDLNWAGTPDECPCDECDSARAALEPKE